MKCLVVSTGFTTDFSFAAHIGAWSIPYTYKVVCGPSKILSGPHIAWFVEVDSVAQLKDLLKAIKARGLTGPCGNPASIILSLFKPKNWLNDIDPTWKLLGEFLQHRETCELLLEVYEYWIE